MPPTPDEAGFLSYKDHDIVFVTDEEFGTALLAPALRTFFRLAEEWQLSEVEQCMLLGQPACSELKAWQRGEIASANDQTLGRISYLLGIYKAINLLLQHFEQQEGIEGSVRKRHPILNEERLDTTAFRDPDILRLYVGTGDIIAQTLEMQAVVACRAAEVQDTTGCILPHKTDEGRSNDVLRILQIQPGGIPEDACADVLADHVRSVPSRGTANNENARNERVTMNNLTLSNGARTHCATGPRFRRKYSKMFRYITIRMPAGAERVVTLP